MDEKADLASLPGGGPSVGWFLFPARTIWDLFDLRLTFSVDLRVVLALILAVVLLIYVIIRYQFLTVYSYYSRVPGGEVKSDGIHQFSDVSTDPFTSSNKSDLVDIGERDFVKGFLATFLQGVRVFGYIEEPVFNELAKRLQTRKIPKGDLLFQDSVAEKNANALDRSFYIVVDGQIDVMITSRKEPGGLEENDFEFAPLSDGYQSSGKDQGLDDVESHGWKLLHSAGPGDTVSSLFVILDLLTENLPLRGFQGDGVASSRKNPSERQSSSLLSSEQGSFRHTPNQPTVRMFPQMTCTEDPPPPADVSSTHAANPQSPSPVSIEESGVASSMLGLAAAPACRRVLSSTGLTRAACHWDQCRQPDSLSRLTQLHHDKLRHLSFNGGLSARASRDTTLIVLPAETFTKLAAKFPTAASHMVQVILTRFHSVTMNTVKHYMNMPQESIRIEKALAGPLMAGDTSDMYDLDDELAVGMLDQLRESTGQYCRSPSVAPGYKATENDPWDTRRHSLGTDNFLPQRPLMGASLAGDLESPTRMDLNPGVPLRSDSIRGAGADNYTRIRQVVYNKIMSNLCLKEQKSTHPLAGSSSRPAHTDMSSVKGWLNDSRSSRFGSPASMSKAMRPRSNSGSSSSGVSNPSTQSRTGGMGPMSSVVEDRLVRILFYEAGSKLIQENTTPSGLFYLVDGLVRLSSNNTRFTTLLTPGSFIGYLSCLTGTPASVSATAESDICVGLVPQTVMNRWIDRRPDIILKGGKRLLLSASHFMLQIDIALEWNHLSAGEVLYNQGDSSLHSYAVVHGRLRSLRHSLEEGPSRKIVAEYGQGDYFGELESLSGDKRRSTMIAIRESEVVRIPNTVLSSLPRSGHNLVLDVGKSIVQRAIRSHEAPSLQHNNLKTVTLLPLAPMLPLQLFAEKMKDAMEALDADCLILTQVAVLSVLGKHAFSKMGKLKLNNWLSQQEARYRLVIYVATGSPTSTWVRRCIQKADCVLLIGHADSLNRGVSDYERAMLHLKCGARKELVLIHQERRVNPGSTRTWLKRRPWIHAHHHMQLRWSAACHRDEVTDALGIVGKRTLGMIGDFLGGTRGLWIPGFYTPLGASRLRTYNQTSTGDFERIARRFLGKSIGLVLGGGGARGIAHLGVIKALEEAGIPIDMVGGTSIGAFVGGLYAWEASTVTTTAGLRFFSYRMMSYWRKLLDLTFPLTSYFTGHEMNRALWKIFGSMNIEDLWIPYFAVTTNISHSRAEAHTQGYLWKFVRASMSLSGFLPPVCDEGNLLVDGGYLDILPVELMRRMGAETAIAVDVGSGAVNAPVYYGDSLSAWTVILNRFNPFRRSKIPTLSEIQSKLAYVSSVKKLEKVEKDDHCIYLRPEVSQFGTLAFDKYEAAYLVGYGYAKQNLHRMKHLTKKPRVAKMGRRNSF